MTGWRQRLSWLMLKTRRSWQETALSGVGNLRLGFVRRPALPKPIFIHRERHIMTGIARFNPFRRFMHADPFGREIDDLFRGFFLTPTSPRSTLARQIPIDITEDEKSYRIRAEMPGLNKTDIQLSVSGDRVTISTETKQEMEEKTGEQVVLRECFYDGQYCALTLPQAVDDTTTTAKYADGVLELILPKTGTATRKIAIT